MNQLLGHKEPEQTSDLHTRVFNADRKSEKVFKGIKMLTPSLPQLAKLPGGKMHGRVCKQRIFRPITSTFTAVRNYENPFTCQCEKENTKT